MLGTPSDITVVIGSELTGKYSKTVTVAGMSGGCCPAVVDKKNWVQTNGRWGDTFRITVNGERVTARRIDNFNAGWGMDLRFVCTARGSYINARRAILELSLHPNGGLANWYRRSGSVEDPWLSITNHVPAVFDGDVVYGANSFGSPHASNVLPVNNGANVSLMRLVRPCWDVTVSTMRFQNGTPMFQSLAAAPSHADRGVRVTATHFMPSSAPGRLRVAVKSTAVARMLSRPRLRTTRSARATEAPSRRQPVEVTAMGRTQKTGFSSANIAWRRCTRPRVARQRLWNQKYRSKHSLPPRW